MLAIPRPATALMAGPAGCTLVAGAPPAVEVMDVRPLGIGLTERQLAVTPCVTNPNRRDRLPARDGGSRRRGPGRG